MTQNEDRCLELVNAGVNIWVPQNSGNFSTIWSLTVREEGRLRAFENRMLGRIFGPRMNEVTGEWRKLPNEELKDLYYTLNIVWVIKSRRERVAEHAARMEEERRIKDFGVET